MMRQVFRDGKSQTTAVPASCEASHDASAQVHPHSLEADVTRQLLALPQLRFSRLVVRRLPKGVLLEGAAECTDDERDVRQLVQTALGLDDVINHVVLYRNGCTATD